ncbi:MAG: MATE family efflux transporter, partial [Clostridia bacterium]|nr:MATE family efflux transporter [Clostridia bacterium]
MAGQNLGAGLPERAKATARHGVGISMAITVVIFALVQLFPQTLLSIFQPEPEVMELAVQYLRPCSIEYLFLAVLMPINGLIIGSGHTLIPMISAIISSVAVRVPMAYLFGLALDLGVFGVGLGTGFAAGAGMVFCLCYLATGRWKRGDHGRGKPAAEEETC